MKINRVEIIPVDIPYHTPFRVSSGGAVSSNFIIVKIVTDEGIEGIGSSIGIPVVGQNRESMMASMKSLASAVLLGQDPLNTERILSQIDARLPANYRIKAHIDYALYDLKGRILNVPVYQLLGGLCREKIPLEMIIMMDEPKVQADMAVKYISAGFHSIKLHTGGDLKMAVKRFKTVREAVGPDIPIGIDVSSLVGAPSHCNAHDALQLIEALVEYDINFAEQVVTTDDIDGFVSIKSRTKVPLVADASAQSVPELYTMIKRGAADIFHTLLGRIGGIRKALQYTTLVEAADLDYAICVLGTGIEHAVGAHFAVSRSKRDKVLDELGLLFYIHGVTETKEITGDVVKEINGRIEKGYLYPPKGPGLGIELDEDVVKRHLATDVHTIVVK